MGGLAREVVVERVDPQRVSTLRGVQEGRKVP
jgi:hypothetical protein